MTLFKNKYRVESARLKGWDYSSEGCTRDREPLLGRVENGEMKLSKIGKIVYDEWIKSFKIRSELFCDAFTRVQEVDSFGSGIDSFMDQPVSFEIYCAEICAKKSNVT